MDGKQGAAGAENAFIALFQRTADAQAQISRITEVFEALLPAAADQMGRLLQTELTLELGEIEETSLSAACYTHGDMVRAIYHATGWNCPVVVFAERRLPNAALELMFGATEVANLTSDAFDPEGTTGEVAQKIVVILARALSAATANLGIGELEQRALEVPENADPIARTDFDMFTVTVASERFGGRAFVFLLPSKGLAAADDKRRENAGETGSVDRPGASDERWSGQLQKRILATHMSLEAYVDGPKMTLEQLMALKPGSLITLAPGEFENVRVGYDNIPALRGSLVQSGGVYSVDVQAYILPDEDEPTR